jgi:hypothetical protein
MSTFEFVAWKGDKIIHREPSPKGARTICKRARTLMYAHRADEVVLVWHHDDGRVSSFGNWYRDEYGRVTDGHEGVGECD